MSIRIRVQIGLRSNTTSQIEIYDITDYVMSANWTLGSTDVMSRVGFEGKADLKVNNESKLFTPNNSDSPLYSKFLAGTPIQIDVYNSLRDEWVRMWTGFVHSVTYQAVRNQHNLVEISCSQTFDKLINKGLKANGLINATAKQIIEELVKDNYYVPAFQDVFVLDVSRLDSIPLSNPSDFLGEISTGATYAIYGFGLNEQSALYDTLTSIAQSEQGIITFNREGRLIFISATDLALKPFTYNMNLEDLHGLTYSYGDYVYNQVEITYTPKSENTGVFWEGEFTLQNNESISFGAEPRQDSQTDKVSIVSVSGVSTTPQTNVSYTHDSSSVEVVLTNTTGSQQVFQVQVSGTYYTADDPVTITEKDSESISKINRVSINTLDLPILSRNGEALRVAQNMLYRYSEPKGFFKDLKIKSASPSHIDKITSLSVGSTLQLSSEVVNEENVGHVIIGESCNWTPQYLELTYTLDSSNRANYFILDVSELDDGRLS